VLAASILLASASPRRRAILETLGHSVRVRPVAVDEDERPGESAETYLARIVDEKLSAALAMTLSAALSPDGDAGGWDALLVADTTVALDHALLHKPVDDDDARRILRTLSARTHVVTTRFALASADGRTHVESVATRVVMRAIEPDELDAYVAIGEGRDKAGAYAIQGGASAFIQRIEGSYGAVVGLPACEVTLALRGLLGGP
jgi:septum formation protein